MPSDIPLTMYPPCVYTVSTFCRLLTKADRMQLGMCSVVYDSILLKRVTKKNTPHLQKSRHQLLLKDGRVSDFSVTDIPRMDSNRYALYSLTN